MIVQDQYKSEWLCQTCGADFRNWLQIPGEDRREFLRRNPHYDILNLQDGKCPRCGFTLSIGKDCHN